MTPARLIGFIIYTLMLVLVIAMARMQIVNGADWRTIAEKNYIRIQRLSPQRGEIYDREFRPIVINQPSLNLYYIPGKVKHPEILSVYVSRLFSLPKEEIVKIIKANRFRSYEEILLVQNVSSEDFVRVSESLNYFPELLFKTESIRSYQFPSHFTGYVKQINEAEFATLKDKGYSINDMIGKSGIERYYEQILRGVPGYRIIQVDASGKSLQLLKHNLEQPTGNGMQVVLTVDMKLQKYVQGLMTEEEGANGAVVVMDVKTGGILAYVSSPWYDPNVFTGRIPQAVWNGLIQDPDKPLMDRVIQGTYPPGSIFKPLVGLAGLENKVMNENTTFSPCVGGLQIGNRFYRCWHAGGHGYTTLRTAIQVSCDVYFYELGMKLGLDRFHDYAFACRFIPKTGVDLMDERSGFFPDREWYQKHYGKYFGERGRMANLGIGQGEVLVSPLAACAWYNAIANGGIWIQPHLFDRALGPNEKAVNSAIRFKRITLPITGNHLQLIEESLYKVVNEPGGTGGRALVPGVTVYGKTGSAENAFGTTTHAWFSGYAAWEEKEISFTVFLENYGHGGSAAAPIAGKIIEFYHHNIHEGGIGQGDQ